MAETIKVLNDDDALELFKKTLPSGASFMQIQATTGQMRSEALTAVRLAITARKKTRASMQPKLEFIALALSGKQQGFEKVIGMIDEMIALLHNEQKNDDDKKEYCAKELDSAEDKQKVLENSLEDADAAIADMEGSIASLTEEISALEAGIKTLDQSVADATALRKSEHAAYVELQANDSAAKEVLLWAKNRLNKYYNPKMYKAAPKPELSEADGITVAMGGTLAPTPAPGGIAGTGISLLQTSSNAQNGAAPPPPPETFGPYAKKGAQSVGVISMIDLLVHDLDTEMDEAAVMEKDAQSEYEAMLAAAAAKRAEDAKSMTDKASSKASEQEALEAQKSDKAAASSELAATLENIHSLHGECDWLTKYFDTRKNARTEEIESLGRAKAVLSGADYS